MKIKALITLTVGKQKDVPPGKIYDLGDSEAKRLIALGFAESVKNPKCKNRQRIINPMRKDRKMVLPLEKAVNSLFTRMGRIGNYKERQVLFYYPPRMRWLESGLSKHKPQPPSFS